MRKVEYWIDNCYECPYHEDAETDEFDSYCYEHKTYFIYGETCTGGYGSFPDWCELQTDEAKDK